MQFIHNSVYLNYVKSEGGSFYLLNPTGFSTLAHAGVIIIFYLMYILSDFFLWRTNTSIYKHTRTF